MNSTYVVLHKIPDMLVLHYTKYVDLRHGTSIFKLYKTHKFSTFLSVRIYGMFLISTLCGSRNYLEGLVKDNRLLTKWLQTMYHHRSINWEKNAKPLNQVSWHSHNGEQGAQRRMVRGLYQDSSSLAWKFYTCYYWLAMASFDTFLLWN